MIPSIGIMIGFYIITRMLSFLTRATQPEVVIVRIFAVITILVTVIMMFGLWSTGSVSPSL